jgi:hypothetical protein
VWMVMAGARCFARHIGPPLTGAELYRSGPFCASTNGWPAPKGGEWFSPPFFPCEADLPFPVIQLTPALAESVKPGLPLLGFTSGVVRAVRGTVLSSAAILPALASRQGLQHLGAGLLLDHTNRPSSAS